MAPRTRSRKEDETAKETTAVSTEIPPHPHATTTEMRQADRKGIHKTAAAAVGDGEGEGERQGGFPGKNEEENAKKKFTSPSSSHEVSEFGGPVGAVFLMLGLPLVVCLLFFLCNSEYCFVLPFEEEGGLNGLWVSALKVIETQGTWRNIVVSALIALFWFAFQVFLERCLPASVIEGAPLVNPDGTRQTTKLPYRINAHLAFWVSLLLVCVGLPSVSLGSDGVISVVSFHRFPLDLLYDLYFPLILVTWTGCNLMSLVLYLCSFRKGALLSGPGTTGSVLTDLFMGRELNPRSGCDFDWKFFCELRPGLIGWVVLNLGMAVKQWTALGRLSAGMVLVNLFQGVYVWDALYHEAAVLTTMDITTDGFGFMLAFGDLCWVPFTYSLQARVLVDRPDNLGIISVVLICILNFAGYAIFRLSNSEKDLFRRDPSHRAVRHLQTMETKTGRKLLLSGWWGLARKINYTGDWMMGLAWCLAAGQWGKGGSLVVYFYAVYFLFLLVHRAYRDDVACRGKYGEDWKEYKRKVPFVFVPGII
uniref:Delta(14)-sterol reductase n=1 Tax=Chromera velia CCMP2878 TaxID=1169474 RepID=A0A0G4H1E9_9ALVE|eukprot:Cvel_24293.t1-p1 / transcript=Cvel_24293.t1 / gene=Cvel_24293 / organism=Chromera_velia_CCMP2878 / gene_product=Delta(14)-sterol reductase, putative / transcript_product=Delta(14)-sterol reductase, putative / location=Cvel_scaffold2607:21120-24601(+) / protein_length=533 / sequence_SO=supercontig / SO=protein_coding / is_pseudo=false